MVLWLAKNDTGSVMIILVAPKERKMKCGLDPHRVGTNEKGLEAPIVLEGRTDYSVSLVERYRFTRASPAEKSERVNLPRETIDNENIGDGWR